MSHCTAAMMETAVAGPEREQDEVFEQAVDFIKQYYAQLKGYVGADNGLVDMKKTQQARN